MNHDQALQSVADTQGRARSAALELRDVEYLAQIGVVAADSPELLAARQRAKATSDALSDAKRVLYGG